MIINHIEELRNLSNYTDIMNYILLASKQYGVEFEKELWGNQWRNLLKHNPEYIKRFAINTWGDITNHSVNAFGIEMGNLAYIRDRLLLPNISNKTVLELGSGTGRWTYLLKSAEKLICVDMVKEVGDILKLYDINLDFYVNNGYNLEFIDDKSIDFIFAYDVFLGTEIEHIIEYYHEFYRILKDKGMILSTFSCNSKFLSKLYKFTPLSMKDIISLHNNNNFNILECNIDILYYGVVVLSEKI